MFRAGVVTIYVSDMDRAVKFYTEALGFPLKERYGNHWASIDGGPGLSIGLHPATPDNPAGRSGSIALGLYLTEPINAAVKTLTSRGVQFTSPIVNDDGVLSFASFTDPDGNPLYLAEMAQAYK